MSWAWVSSAAEPALVEHAGLAFMSFDAASRAGRLSLSDAAGAASGAPRAC
jgi:hypothetical protein